MPDRFGFDHLGVDVRCIDCAAGGPRWRFPDSVRARHFAGHERARQRDKATRAREVEREATRRLRELNRLRREART